MSIRHARQGLRALTTATCDRCGMSIEMPFSLAAPLARDVTTVMFHWWTDDKERDLCFDCYLIHGTGEGPLPLGILNA